MAGLLQVARRRRSKDTKRSATSLIIYGGVLGQCLSICPVFSMLLCFMMKMLRHIYLDSSWRTNRLGLVGATAREQHGKINHLGKIPALSVSSRLKRYSRRWFKPCLSGCLPKRCIVDRVIIDTRRGAPRPLVKPRAGGLRRTLGGPPRHSVKREILLSMGALGANRIGMVQTFTLRVCLER